MYATQFYHGTALYPGMLHTAMLQSSPNPSSAVYPRTAQPFELLLHLKIQGAIVAVVWSVADIAAHIMNCVWRMQKLHPAILELGLAYSDGTVVGSSDRCIAMMLAMHCVVRDFKASETQAFSRALTSYINSCVGFLWDECRAACVPQRNSIKWLKSTINNVCPLADVKVYALVIFHILPNIAV